MFHFLSFLKSEAWAWRRAILQKWQWDVMKVAQRPLHSGKGSPNIPATTGGINIQHAPETHNGTFARHRCRAKWLKRRRRRKFCTGIWFGSGRTKVTTTSFRKWRTERVDAVPPLRENQLRQNAFQKERKRKNRAGLKMCKSLQGFLPLNRISPGWYQN